MHNDFPDGTISPLDDWLEEAAGPKEASLPCLVAAARAGEDWAWVELRRRFNPMLTGQSRFQGLSPADVDEAVQNTWVKCFAHLDRVQSPEALPGWLRTVCKNEGLRMIRLRKRCIPLDEDPLAALVTRSEPRLPEPLETVIQGETRRELWRAIGRLPRRQRVLLEAMLDPTADAPNYASISRDLAMPVGSIGPTRRRAMERLRRQLAPQPA